MYGCEPAFTKIVLPVTSSPEGMASVTVNDPGPDGPVSPIPVSPVGPVGPLGPVTSKPTILFTYNVSKCRSGDPKS